MRWIPTIEIWKVSYKAHSEAVNRRELLLGQVFAIVLGQCSPTVVDRLKANAEWTVVNNGNDLMGLLRLIRTSMYTGATSKNPIQSLLEAQTKFLSFRQGSRMSNAEYLRNFTALSDQVVHLHGELGTDQAYVTTRIREDGDDPDDGGGARHQGPAAGVLFAQDRSVLRADEPRLHGL